MTTSEDRPLENRPFPLLNLPPELWSRICRLAISDTVALNPCGLPVKWNVMRTEAQPPITKVCKIIRGETLPIAQARAFVYKDWTAGSLEHIHGPAALVYWLQRLSVTGKDKVMFQGLCVESGDAECEARYGGTVAEVGCDIGEGIAGSDEGVKRYKVSKGAPEPPPS